MCEIGVCQNQKKYVLMLKRGWEAISKCLLEVVCVSRDLSCDMVLFIVEMAIAMLVGFLMVITWWRNQSAKVEENLFLQVKNNFVQVLN